MQTMSAKAHWIGTMKSRSGVSKPKVGMSSSCRMDAWLDEKMRYTSRVKVSMVRPFHGRPAVRSLQEYSTNKRQVKKLVRRFRQLAEQDEDGKKAFALLEMRSRVMESDIAQKWRRRGGTVVVDDIVLTPYYQASHRIRDAVIVSKAWREGANPRDVFTAYTLSSHKLSTLDDTDFWLLRCASTMPKQMRGFEMFKLSNCHTMLLQLTKDHVDFLGQTSKWCLEDVQQAELRLTDDVGVDWDIISYAERFYQTAIQRHTHGCQQLHRAQRSFQWLCQCLQDDQADDDDDDSTTDDPTTDDESDHNTDHDQSLPQHSLPFHAEEEYKASPQDWEPPLKDEWEPHNANEECKSPQDWNDCWDNGDTDWNVRSRSDEWEPKTQLLTHKKLKAPSVISFSN